MSEHERPVGTRRDRQFLTDEASARIRAEVETFRLLLVAQAMSEACARGDEDVTGADVRTAVARLRSGDRRLATAGVAGGACVTLVATVLAAPGMPAVLLATVLWAAVVALAVAVLLVRQRP